VQLGGGGTGELENCDGGGEKRERTSLPQQAWRNGWFKRRRKVNWTWGAREGRWRAGVILIGEERRGVSALGVRGEKRKKKSATPERKPSNGSDGSQMEGTERKARRGQIGRNRSSNTEREKPS